MKVHELLHMVYSPKVIEITNHAKSNNKILFYAKIKGARIGCDAQKLEAQKYRNFGGARKIEARNFKGRENLRE